MSALDELFMEIEGHKVMRAHAKLLIAAKTQHRELEAERDAAVKLLSDFAFVSVLSGESGWKYTRCRVCSGDNYNPNGNEYDWQNVKHEQDCTLAALLEPK